MQESDLVRTPEYWGSLENDLRNDVVQRDRELKQALDLHPEREFLRLLIATGTEFPKVQLSSNGDIEVIFSEFYFQHMDHAAIAMSVHPPFREALALASTFSENDLSRYCHLTWSRWVLLHEVGHVISGHLHFVPTKELVEFPALEQDTQRAGGLPVSLRRAMEVDADMWAARAMFRTWGSMTVKGYWDDLYRRPDAVSYAMQDLAIIFWFLFLELDHASPNTPTTHPSVYERIVSMQIAGFSGYLARVGDAGREHLSSFLAGQKKAIELTAGILRQQGTLLRKKPESIDFTAYWKELSAARVQDRRLYPIENDWLQRIPPALQTS